MYGTFTDAKLLGGVTYGGTVLDDIGGQFAGPLLDITLQDPTRSLSRYATLYAVEPGAMRPRAPFMGPPRPPKG